MKNLIAAVLLLVVGSAQAAAVFTMVESGGDVVLSGAGSIDLTGLTFANTVSTAGNPFVNPGLPNFRTGDTTFHNLDVYSGLTGPAAFGSGGMFPGTGGSGDVFGVRGATALYVPEGYVSGSPLAGTGVWAGATFVSMGVAAGTYVWSWSGDSITLNVIPIPAAVWLFGSALAGLGWMRRKQTV